MERKTHWDNVYGQKSPREVSWYQASPDLSLQLIGDTGLALDAPLIDVGGGASVLVDRLCEQGFTNIAVLDISQKALEQARRRLAGKACRVTWFESDIIGFEPPHRFMLWHDRAVFHFLTCKKDRAHYVDTLKATLEPGGHLIMAAFAIGGPQKCSGLDIVQYDAVKLVSELGGEFELVEETIEVHLTPAGNEQEFAYFRLARKRR